MPNLYPLKFVQKDICRDDTDHEHSLIFTFYSPKTGLKYVLRAEYYSTDTYAIKFYAKRDRRNNNRYSKIINRGDVKNILLTAGQLVRILLDKNSTSSFAFSASRTLDPIDGTVEPIEKNQRYRIYKTLIERFLGPETFKHLAYPDISCYLLINKKNVDLVKKQAEIENSFKTTYDDLLNVI